MKNTSRHPAVIDLLGGAPLPISAGRPAGVTSPQPDKASKPPRYLAALIMVVALLGWFLLRIFSGDEEAARIVDESSTSESAPPRGTAPPTLAAEPAPETDPGACRTDRGDQKSGPGVIAAFEYAYYVTRSGTAVRALTTPETSLPPAEKIQAGIDTVPTGTTHCVRITPITPDTYSVALAEMRPGAEPAQFPQTITTKEIDSRWFVDVIN